MQLARHLAKRFGQQPQLIRQVGIQRRDVELTMFNVLAGGDQLVKRLDYLLANAPQGEKDQREDPDAARQRYADHQHHLALGIVLQRQNEEIDLIRHSY
ncbi:Uncharacterised protein [Citrobacter koseri]|uniref:Uncharacterized protein n=1 Tax=Citrobacter koseri TaxID=545 RepID=A0A447UIY0_CITKO|nr:Uncharacterised protein [Citrobacter koseri]